MASAAILERLGAQAAEEWPQGIYFSVEALRTAIVVVHQLPPTQETLWLRLLGRGRVQAQAIREILALPQGLRLREIALKLLASWGFNMETTEGIEPSEQEVIMALSQAFLEWEEKTKQQSRQEVRQEGRQEAQRDIAIKLLGFEQIAQVTELTVEQIQQIQSEH